MTPLNAEDRAAITDAAALDAMPAATDWQVIAIAEITLLGLVHTDRYRIRGLLRRLLDAEQQLAELRAAHTETPA